MIAPKALKSFMDSSIKLRAIIREGIIPGGYYLIVGQDAESLKRFKEDMERQGKDVKCLSNIRDVLDVISMDGKRIICVYLFGNTDLPNQYMTVPQLRVV